MSYLTGGETQDRLIYFVSVVLFCFLKHVAQVGVELPVVLLSLPPECWDYRHASTSLSSDAFVFISIF